MLGQILAQQLQTWRKGNDKEEKASLPTMHGSDALKALEIPQLDGHVCRARC